MNANTDIDVLNSIYRNSKTGCESITDLIPKVTDSSFRNALKTQRHEYSSISHDAARMLTERGSEPKDIGAMQKAGMKVSVDFNTLIDCTSSHCAEMMIEGSSMGITSMTKVLNSYDKSDRDITGLAQKLIETEQRNIETMKTYLH